MDGLLRRRIEYSAKDYEGGSRTLDFTQLLEEKENEIALLQRRIENYEARLKRASVKELELESRIQALTAENFTLKDKGLVGERLSLAVAQELKINTLTKEIEIMRENFASAASIWNFQVKQILDKYPSDRFILNPEISEILQKANIQTYNVNGI